MLGAILEQIENDKFSFWVKKTLAAEDGIYACFIRSGACLIPQPTVSV
jgi:hypothetical protein